MKPVTSGVLLLGGLPSPELASLGRHTHLPGQQRSQALTQYVRCHEPAVQPPGSPEAQGHGWIQVRTRNVPDRIDHRHDHETERQAHTHLGHTARHVSDDDGTRSREHQRESPDAFRYVLLHDVRLR